MGDAFLFILQYEIFFIQRLCLRNLLDSVQIIGVDPNESRRVYSHLFGTMTENINKWDACLH